MSDRTRIKALMPLATLRQSRYEKVEEHVEEVDTGKSNWSPEPDIQQTIFAAMINQLRLTLWTVFMTSAATLAGYEQVSIGLLASSPKFQDTFGEPSGNEHVIPAYWISLFAIAYPLGMALGAAVGGFAQDMYGRKYTLFAATFWEIASITVCFVSDMLLTSGTRSGLYFFGKFLQGLGIGAIVSTLQTYVSEILPTTLSGPVQSLIAPFTLVGQLIGSIVTNATLGLPTNNSYRLSIAGQWVLSLIPLALSIALPESPAWLLRGGDISGASVACQRLAGSRNGCDRNMLQQLQDDSNSQAPRSEASKRISYLALFQQRSDMKRTLIILFASTIPQLFGSSLLNQSSYVLQGLGASPDDATKNSIVAACVGLGSMIVAFVVVSKFGRRTLTVLPLGGIAAIWLAVGISGCLPSSESTTFISVAFVIIIFVASLTTWPTSFIIAGETSSLTLRAKSQGLSWFTRSIATALFAGLLPPLYNPDAANMGGRIGFIFAVLTGIAGVIAWNFVPETIGLSPRAIDTLYKHQHGLIAVRQWDVEQYIPSRNGKTYEMSVRVEGTT